jgi:glutaredoxin
MKVIRWFLGRLILGLNAVFSPRGIRRPLEEQQKVDDAVAHLTLYQFEACPFCVKVRRVAKQLSLPLQTRDAKKSPWEAELIEQGGHRKVPCLRIEKNGDIEWMYESSDIIAYLQQRFA